MTCSGLRIEKKEKKNKCRRGSPCLEHVVAVAVVASVVVVAGAVQEPLRQVGTTRHVLRLQRLPMSICQLNALFTANDSLLLLLLMMSMLACLPACLYLPQRRPTGCLLLPLSLPLYRMLELVCCVCELSATQAGRFTFFSCCALAPTQQQTF